MNYLYFFVGVFSGMICLFLLQKMNSKVTKTGQVRKSSLIGKDYFINK